MPKAFHWVYFVSGHGYGHASRSALVMAALLTDDPAARVSVVSHAPRRFFEALPGVVCHAPAAEMEAGLVERDSLRPDLLATFARLAAVGARRDSYVAALRQQLTDLAADGVVLDAPHLAARAARLYGGPAAVVSNFTWDWIYRPLVQALAADGQGGNPADNLALVEAVRDDYANLPLMLRLPFGGSAEVFTRTLDVPLVAPPRGDRPVSQTLAELSLDPHDGRPRVLVPLRGGLSGSSLARAVAGEPDILWLSTRELAGGECPENFRHVVVSPQRPLADLVAACDVVLSKLGYGIVSECLAAGTALVWPPREHFAEDALTAAALPGTLRCQRLSREDFEAGCWGPAVRAVLDQPYPSRSLSLDGAAVCAAHLRALARGGALPAPGSIN